MTIPHWSWSFSSLGLFECPKRYEIIRAKKLIIPPPPEPGNAGEEGARLHEVIEKYIRDDVWSDELKPWKRILDVYKEKGGICEEEYAFKWIEISHPEMLMLGKSKVLVRCKADDPDAWYRGYIDWMKIDDDYAEVVDWKTGRVKVTNQLKLYAWVVMTAHPEIERVKATFHWLKFNDQLSEYFERKYLDRIFQPFQEIIDQINHCYESDVWIELPGNIQKSTGRGEHCRFCCVTKEYCSEGI